MVIMRNIVFPIALAFGLIAAPAVAQTAARDFTLPQGPTQPESRPQGPVDDTGIIPVGPRVIRTEPEQPVTSNAPSEVTQPTTAQNQPDTRPQTAPAPSPGPARTTTSEPRPTPVTAPREPGEDAVVPMTQEDVPEQSVKLPSDTQPDISATTGMPEMGETTEESSFFTSPLPQWVLWLAAALGLAALLLGLIAFLRRRAELRPPPEIERPVVSMPAPAVIPANELRFTARFDVQGFTRSMMMVTVKFSLSIANRSDIAMRDVRICADLVSARRQLPMEQQVATESIELPQVAEIERIGPQQARSVKGTLQLPVDSIEPFFQGKTPLFVPLARLCVECAGAEPHLQTYVVGMGSVVSVGKVSPIPLNTPPGNVQGVMARALD